MNLVDCYVTKVLSDPYYVESFGVSWWAVDVEYNSWGTPAGTTLPFHLKSMADEVKEGFHFLA